MKHESITSGPAVTVFAAQMLDVGADLIDVEPLDSAGATLDELRQHCNGTAPRVECAGQSGYVVRVRVEHERVEGGL